MENESKVLWISLTYGNFPGVTRNTLLLQRELLKYVEDLGLRGENGESEEFDKTDLTGKCMAVVEGISQRQTVYSMNREAEEGDEETTSPRKGVRTRSVTCCKSLRRLNEERKTSSWTGTLAWRRKRRVEGRTENSAERKVLRQENLKVGGEAAML